MSTFKVTIERLEILPHPNADRLELAKVGGYHAVVGKDVYKTGDYALYIPEQAVLKDNLIEHLDLVGKLAGKGKDRVKAVHLRGALSQGIVCRPFAMRTWTPAYWEDALTKDVDWAEAFGISKWVPEIPTEFSGKLESTPELIRWSDIENIQRYPDIFTTDEMVVATEKIHGTCCLITYIHGDPGQRQVFVSSKGHGAKSLSLSPNMANLYWKAVLGHKIPEKLHRMAKDLGATKIGLFGEVYGRGVQDLTYGMDAGSEDTVGFLAFDCWIEDRTPDEPDFISAWDFHSYMAEFAIPAAPVLYQGPFQLKALHQVASGPSVVLTAPVGQIREGVVIRPQFEQKLVHGGRKIAKLVSPQYLTRKNGTEYE